jgi:hypothetical protein
MKLINLLYRLKVLPQRGREGTYPFIHTPLFQSGEERRERERERESCVRRRRWPGQRLRAPGGAMQRVRDPGSGDSEGDMSAWGPGSLIHNERAAGLLHSR